jgi:hypothetical protein
MTTSVLVTPSAHDMETAAVVPPISYRKNNVWEHLPSHARFCPQQTYMQ